MRTYVFFFSTSVLNSTVSAFQYTKMLYKYMFGKVKTKKNQNKTKTNVGRNLIILEKDKLSSLLPLVNLQEIHMLFLSRLCCCRALRSQPHLRTCNTVPECKLHFELYDYVITYLRHLQIFVFQLYQDYKRTSITETSHNNDEKKLQKKKRKK